MSALAAATDAAVAAVESGSSGPLPSGQPPTAPQTAPAVPAAATPTAPTVASDPAPQTATPTPTGAAAVPLDDNTIYMIDGVPKTGREIRDERLMRADYTRKTQELAAQRKQFEALQPEIRRVVEERQKLVQFLQDPRVQSALKTLSQPAATQAPPAPAFDPNEIATVGQAQQVAQQQVAALQARLAQAEQQFQQQLAAMETSVMDRAQQLYEYNQYRQSIDPLVQQLVTKDHPILAAVPEAESLLRYQALQRNPQTLDQAIKVFQEEARAIAGKLQAHWQATMAQQQQASQQLAAQGIEPPGGAPPAVPAGPRTFQKADGSVDWNTMFEQATQYAASQRR